MSGENFPGGGTTDHFSKLPAPLAEQNPATVMGAIDASQAAVGEDISRKKTVTYIIIAAQIPVDDRTCSHYGTFKRAF